MKGREIVPYATSKVAEVLCKKDYEETSDFFLTSGMNPVLARSLGVFNAGLGITMPYHSRVVKDYYERRHENFFALRSLGSAGLDFGVDVITVVLLFRGNPVEAALLKGGYNFACSVVPDVLSSIKNRFGSKAPNINPVQ